MTTSSDDTLGWSRDEATGPAGGARILMSSGRSNVEATFHQAMVEIHRRAKVEAGYSATRFIQMVSEHGGLEAARQLLASSHVSEGFTALWHAGRLDLTVEAHVLQPSFEPLFTSAERRIARWRLEEYGYVPPS